jgi:hypothetical protein
MRAWTVSVSWGELAGFCFPALVGGLLREEPPLLVLGAMVLAGSVEGVVLGWSQARVLRSRLRGLSTGRWVVATAFAAAVAWLIGMSPSTFHEQWSTWPSAVVALVGAVLGALLLSVIGIGQWLELRRHDVPLAARWIAYTAAGWGAGLVVFTAVATPLWQPGQETLLIAGIGIVAGALMALTMAVVTGLGMRRLLADTGVVSTSSTTGVGSTTGDRSTTGVGVGQRSEGSRSGEAVSLGGSTNR